MKKQALNFLWLGLDLPAIPCPYEDHIYNPMPSEYIENVNRAAKNNPETDTSLWVDSERLTPLQYAWLKAALPAPVKLQDLRSIPEYNSEALYNEGDANKCWREENDQSSLIWRQVDAAKVLITLQGDYEQSFFTDMDYAHLELNSDEIQERMNEYGFLIGEYSCTSDLDIERKIENQFFGITKENKEFFKDLYVKTIDEAYKGENGWPIFVEAFTSKIKEMGSTQATVAYSVKPKGSPAFQPGAQSKYGVLDDSGHYFVKTPSMIGERNLIHVNKAKLLQP